MIPQPLSGGGYGDGVAGVVSAVAAQYGVPDYIALDIMQQESGGNPFAVGDYGTSFGLFQLHYGGQGNGYSASQLLNPQQNAQIAMPYIAKGYQWAIGHGDTGFNLLVDTADHSGHPDSTGYMPSSYLAGLRQIYGGASASAASSVSSATSGITAGTFQFLQGLDQSMSFQGFDPLHPFSFVTTNGEALGLRAFLIIVGILLVAFALLSVVKDAERIKI